MKRAILYDDKQIAEFLIYLQHHFPQFGFHKIKQIKRSYNNSVFCVAGTDKQYLVKIKAPLADVFAGAVVKDKQRYLNEKQNDALYAERCRGVVARQRFLVTNDAATVAVFAYISGKTEKAKTLSAELVYKTWKAFSAVPITKIKKKVFSFSKFFIVARQLYQKQAFMTEIKQALKASGEKFKLNWDKALKNAVWTFQHGDFGARNLVLQGAQLVLIDNEFNHIGLYGIDLLHYAVAQNPLVLRYWLKDTHTVAERKTMRLSTVLFILQHVVLQQNNKKAPDVTLLRHFLKALI